MTDITKNKKLWQNGMLPEEILERWFVDNGTPVTAGERSAEVQFEGALHDIMSRGEDVLIILAPKTP